MTTKRKTEQLNAASIPGFLPPDDNPVRDPNDEEQDLIASDETQEVIDIEARIVPNGINGDGEERRLQVRTTIPGTLDDIASQSENFKAILQTRFETVDLLRRLSIHMTTPSDWVLYKADDPTTGRAVITGYLQDQGCRRIAGNWNIKIRNVSQPMKIESSDEGRCSNDKHKPLDLHEMSDDCVGWNAVKVFYYVIAGDARCGMTGEEIEGLQGMQSSEADFVRQQRMNAIKRDMFVCKAARTNLLGTATRDLTGLKNFLVGHIIDGAWELTEQARAAWEGTGKDWRDCPKGRGFGSSADRHGAGSEAPTCPKCKGPMKFIPGGTSTTSGKAYSAFWGCKKGREKCDGTRKAS